MLICSAGFSARGQQSFICRFCMHSADHSALSIAGLSSGKCNPGASGSGALTPE